MILTELITNAVKHAFPGGRSGTIAVSLNKTDGGAVIEVADNGIGFPAGFDMAASVSLGLTLVRSLAGQIQGDFRIERADRTRCMVAFPIKETL